MATMSNITPICPTCGCSLVRLGISSKQSKSLIADGEKYYFCCEGCLNIFQKNPKPFIKELGDLHVCPVCLAEKISAHTVCVMHDNLNLRFCRCPFCAETFKKTPDYYLSRLRGEIDFKGLFNGQDTSCCEVGEIK